MNYRFHPAAETEHLEQITFYESRQKGLGTRYRDLCLKAIRECAIHPIANRSSIRRTFAGCGFGAFP